MSFKSFFDAKLGLGPGVSLHGRLATPEIGLLRPGHNKARQVDNRDGIKHSRIFPDCQGFFYKKHLFLEWSCRRMDLPPWPRVWKGPCWIPGDWRGRGDPGGPGGRAGVPGPPAGAARGYIYNSTIFVGTLRCQERHIFFSQARSVPTRRRPRPGSRSNCPRKTWNFGAANCRKKERESSQFPILNCFRWPNEYGEQALYDLRVDFTPNGAGGPSTVQQRVGFRREKNLSFATYHI